MTNEIVFVAIALIDLAFVVFALRFGVTGLTGILVANIILVSTLGAKLVSVFGLLTNVGNVFYGATFFAVVMIAEHYDRKQANRSIWIGFVCLVFFVLMGQFTLETIGAEQSAAANQAIATLFTSVPRIALASMVAYMVSQNLNLWIFTGLKRKTGKRLPAIRTIAGAAGGQAVDSLIFFTIAFAGVLSADLLWQSIIGGFVIKTAVGVVSVAFQRLSFLVKPVLN